MFSSHQQQTSLNKDFNSTSKFDIHLIANEIENLRVHNDESLLAETSPSRVHTYIIKTKKQFV